MFDILRSILILLPLCWYGILGGSKFFTSSSICMETFDVDPESFSPIFTPSTFTWSKSFHINCFTDFNLFTFFYSDKTLTSTHKKHGSRPVGRRRARLRLRMDFLASGGSWLICLLLLAGDVELNPGPRSTRYPCGVCRKAVKYRDRAVACDTCNIWYHTDCMKMNSVLFESLRDSDISWTCLACGVPNFSSRLFETSFSTTPNPFEPLNVSGCYECKSPTNNFTPKIHSTPKDKSQQKNNPKPSMGKPQNSKCKSNLSFLIANFQSLFKKTVELSHIMKERDIDILIGTETWLTSDIKNSELLLDDYDVYRRDRTNQLGGGVLVCVRKTLNSSNIKLITTSEAVFVKVQFKNKKPIVIGSIYRPTNNCRETCAAICETMHKIYSENNKAIFFIGGDFNLPDINWQDQSIFGNNYPLEINEKMLEITNDLGLTQTIKTPTRGNSILDLLFTNIPFSVRHHEIIPGLADHNMVYATTSLNPPVKKPTKRVIHLWNKTNFNDLKTDVLKFSQTFLKNNNETTNIDSLWLTIKQNLISIVSKNVPTKLSTSKNHQPWITTYTKKLLRKKHRLFKRAKQYNSDRLWNKYKLIKKECQRECRRAHSHYINNIFTEDSQNKKLWTYIKSKRQDSCGIPDLINNNNNKIIQEPLEKANLLNDHFSSVFSDPKPKIKLSNSNQLPEIATIKVTRAGVLKLLLNIKENKATGPDGIPAKLLKICAEELTDVYRLLYQASLDQGMIPEDWRAANILPLFKKGDKSQALNYRPISLTSISCKLLEHIIFSNIMNHLDKHKFLNNFQHGFRKKRSCETQLITTINDFSNCLNNKEQIDAILLDFSKAFDKVDHEGLIMKLKQAGFNNKLLNWSRSFLFDRTQRVIVEGVYSKAQPVLSGVPQGTVLGPLFFLIYINDINSKLSPGTEIRLFADDSLLYRKIKNINDTVILQNDLDQLQLWEQKWKMEFHPQKCELLRITNKRNIINTSYYIHNTKLNQTKSSKYLGVIIDEKLKFKEQHTATLKKANCTLAFLRRNLNKCSPNIKQNCYKTLVRPILEYGSCVWDPHFKKDIENLEIIQKRAGRFITNNYQFKTGNTKINMNQLGFKPLTERRATSKLNLLFKARADLVDIPINHLKMSYRKPENYAIPTSNVDSHLYSFYPSTIRLWNSLPADVKLSKSLDSFKTSLEGITLRASY